MKADPRHPQLAGLAAAIRACRARGSALSLVHLDIDGLRRHLVMHGALAADNKRRNLQRVVADLMRGGDLCTPFAEHHVLVALPECGLQQALEFVERARLRLGQFRLVSSVSIAVVHLEPASSAGAGELIDAARRLVFESKSLGGGHTLCTTLAPRLPLHQTTAEATLN